MTLSKRSTRFRRLALMLFGVIVGLGIAETALRVIGYSFSEFYVPDDSRGYALRPGISGWNHKENDVFIHINSDGLRDRDHDINKPPNTIRIAIVGDSYAEALQVPLEATFWSVMEKRLNECSLNKRVEIINFGVSGYGTAQELLTLREQVWKYSPDIILLAFTTYNDIIDNSRALKKATDVPYFVYKGDQLVLDDSFRMSADFRWRQSAIGRTGRWLRDHFRVVQAILEGHRALRIKLASWRSHQEPLKQAVGPQSRVRAEDVGSENYVYAEPRDQNWSEAWRVTEALLKQFHEEVEAQHSKLLVVTLSNGIQVVPNSQLRAEFKQRMGAKDLSYSDNRVRALGEREGFEVFNLAPQLLNFAEQNNVFLHGFSSDLGSGHWNEKGHLVAGEILSKKLCDEGWLK
jgi:hypothetical protein